jgi:esterase FrsA
MTTQQVFTRSLEELRREILFRVEKKMHPVRNLNEEEVRTVLTQLQSLDPDEWATCWSRLAKTYEDKGKELLNTQKSEAARAFEQAYHYYHFARWPVASSVQKKAAYRSSLNAFLLSASQNSQSLERLQIPFPEGPIIGYLRLPKGERRPPVIFHWGGLDSWKEDFQYIANSYLAQGWGSLIIDIPGTGESPITARPDGEALFCAVLDYLQQRTDIDNSRIALQGSSWGGYWAVKMAHVARARIKASVNWSGPVHYFFQPEWQQSLLSAREYLFDHFEAITSLYKASTLEDSLAKAAALSLDALQLLDMPCSPLLSIHGAKDTLVSIDDAYILAKRSSPKSFWINPQGVHMGVGAGIGPDYILNQVIIPWLHTQLQITK